MIKKLINDDLIPSILSKPSKGRRRLVAIAGAPGAGKSTFAKQLSNQFEAAGYANAIMPMDGFHLDNSILLQFGLLERKGAPETFDIDGFSRLIATLATEDQVFYPKFDRKNDLTIANAGMIDSECNIVLIEGNYLLYDASEWRNLKNQWDVSIWLEVAPALLEQRLIQRWLDHGHPPEQAKHRAQTNDMRNVELVRNNLIAPDFIINQDI